MGNIVSCCCGTEHNEESKQSMSNIDLNKLRQDNDDSQQHTGENEVITSAKNGKLISSERPETKRGVKSQPNLNKQIYDIKRPSCDLDNEIEFNRTFHQETLEEDNVDKLAKRSEELGTKVVKVITFTQRDKIDESELINNHEYRVTMDYSPKGNLGGGVEVNESPKYKRTVIFKELTDKEEKQKKYLIIKYILINLIDNIIGQSVNITEKSKERLTFPASQQSKLPVRYQKYTEKQKEFAIKIVKTNENITESTNISVTNFSKRRDPADLISYSLFELEKLHLRFILDHLFIKSLDKGENLILPITLRQKLEGSLKQTSLGTTEFENLRLSIIYENDALLKNKFNENNLSENILPKITVDNNSDELKDKISNSTKISDFRIKLLYINKFYKQILKEDIAVAINDNLTYNNNKNLDVQIKNSSDSVYSQISNKVSNENQDSCQYNFNKGDRLTTICFFNIHPKFDQRVENSDEAENILNDKEKTIEILFSQSITIIVSIREMVRDKLNKAFINELKEIISVKNKIVQRNTYTNKNNNLIIEESKPDDDNLNDRVATAKYLLNKINSLDPDEIEGERIKYYNEVKESLINDDNYADENDLKNYGNIF